MGKSGKFGLSNSPLSREGLDRLRLKAKRSGAWLKGLKHIERKLLDLTISVVKQVRSFTLTKLVSQIIVKLCKAMESQIARLIRYRGPEMVSRLSKIAESWGHGTAFCWLKDVGFMQFLVINNLGSIGR